MSSILYLPLPHAVFYAFSTENWKRSTEEVAYLMQLFSELLTRMSDELEARSVRVRIVGRRADFSPELQQQMNAIETQSAPYTTTTIWIALSYGGRAEIVEAVNAAVEQGVLVTETSFKELLWTAELPDPDMIVRTSGEARLSNFLTWGSAYSELHLISKHWPALTKSDFDDILMEYGRRTRRYGG
jgi:undecaprenyl diphosphate synthase